MDTDDLRKLLNRLKKKQGEFSFEFNGITFIKIQGDGFPTDCERTVYEVQGRLGEVWMYIVLEYFLNEIRVNYYSEYEISSYLQDIGDKFEKRYLHLVYGFWMNT